MTSSPTAMLSKPVGSGKVPGPTLVYMRDRNRSKLYSLVLGEFQRAGISQKELAERLGKRPEVISRWLASESNWRIDTVSDLLFAISGAAPEYSCAYPLEAPPRNDTRPEWLDDAPAASESPRTSSIVPAAETGSAGGRMLELT